MHSTNLFKIYSSSAGSGKTFTLAKEYIKLLLLHDEPFYFKKILAVTFTNDAANEMKIRILEYLENLSYTDSTNIEKLGKKEFLQSVFLKDLQKSNPEITEEIIQRRAKEAFSTIIHHYSDFSVSTIDSFIQKIVMAFAMQLGFLNNMEIVLDADQILMPAAENFIAKVGAETEATLTEAIIDYVNELAENGKSWNNLASSFADFAKSLFSDSKLKYLEKIQDLSLKSLRNIASQLIDYQEATEQAISKICKQFLQICLQNDLDVSDFYRGKGGGILFVFQKRAQGVDLFEPFTKTVLSVHNDVWYSKTCEKKEIIDQIKPQLYALFCEYEQILETDTKKYILIKAINKNIFKLSLLRQFKQEIELIKTENGQVHISEFNKAILQVVSSEPVPYIYERIGEKYNHIMIDEFQDTSPIQFQNFLPLFANSLANSQFCMVVGDPKQAIYRFRGGDMTQIIHLFHGNTKALKKDLNPDSFLVDNLDQLKPHLHPESLQVNYRSCAEIIDFNNDIFGFIRNYGLFQQEFAMLRHAFDDTYFQDKPSSPKIGAHIEIVFRDQKETEDSGITELENLGNEEVGGSTNSKYEDSYILKIIEDCKNYGYNYSDIAILCRKKDVAKVLANYLKNNSIPIISSDSILLSFSNAVNFIVDLMTVLVNNSSMARYQTICHFHHYILNDAIPANEGHVKQIVDTESIEPLILYFNLFGYNIDLQLLNSLSVYELAEYIIDSFQLFINKGEQDYLFAFLDEIANFKNKKSTDIALFLEYWEQNKQKIAITSNPENAVTITTIHKSKGLQYPVVIVPEATWDFKMRTFDTLWVHLDGIKYSEFENLADQESLKIASLNPNKELMKTEIGEQFHDELELYFLEAINLLYVALTRAENRLYLLTRHQISDKKAAEIETNRKQGEESSIQSIGQIFYHYLYAKGLYNDEKVSYLIHKGNEKLPKKEVFEQQTISASVDTYLLENRPKISVSPTGVANNATEHGKKIHEILAKIYDINDLEPVVNQSVKTGLLAETERADVIEKLNKIVALPGISNCFLPELTVKNEMEILIPNGTSQRPDRVNFFQNETVIIDYKTGHERPEYHSQLRVYGNLLKEMGYPNPKMILIYLENLNVVEVK